MVYATDSLVTVVLDLARDADPMPVSTGVSVTPAGQLSGREAEELDSHTPVFTDFQLPDPGNAVNAVFGVELSTPARSTQGRFVSHPEGHLGVTLADDLAEVIFVAVPPWKSDEDSFGAFDRRGERLPLSVLDAVVPDEPFEQ